MGKLFSDFTGLYPLSKTLRFELKPIGKTVENIEKSGILEQDEHRAESYKKVKKLIDEYHKTFIDNALSTCKLIYDDNGKNNSLSEYYFFYKQGNNAEKRTENLKKVADSLRKQITDSFSPKKSNKSDNKESGDEETSKDLFKRLFAKELIREDLLAYVSEDDKPLVQEFKDFTTYFTGFYDNRKNMYTSEEKSTAIAYRLINENLPKFIDNMTVFEKVNTSDVKNDFDRLYHDFEEYPNVTSIAEMFSLTEYSQYLTQTQIDVYNAVIGGKSLEDGTKIKGLNEYINLYNQRQKDRKNRLPKLKLLYKQILSDRNAISWLPESFATDNELLENIEKCYEDLYENVFKSEKLPAVLKNISNSDLTKIYICNDTQLTDISQQIFGSWSVIPRAIENYYMTENPIKKTENAEKYEERIKKLMKADSYSIQFINDCLNKSGHEETIEQYFANSKMRDRDCNLFEDINKQYAGVKDILNTPYPDGKNLSQDKETVEKIKNLLDAIKDLQHFVKPVLGKGSESDKDEKFYGDLSIVWDELDAITPLYNKVRNYMTRKPYSEEKFKLNFENSTLLDGWDLNKEADNTSVILRKDGLYYLGIMNKKNNKVFQSIQTPEKGSCYEKMEYKLLPGANKMLPKVFFSKSRIAEFAPSEQLKKNYEKGTHKKGDAFNLNDCHALIDFFKRSIQKHEDWKEFGFNFSDTKTYEDLSGFYREVEQQGYKVTFVKVSEEYVNRLVDEGKLYLFQIYNKDFSPYSKGTPNMHTLYWKMLFDESNLKNVVYKLNGQAEVFYRKHSIQWSDEIMKHGHHYADLKDKFSYPIIKDRRYTVDKFQFHVPITMNFKAVGTNNINPTVNEYIRESNDLHIIGIDRGERHLLYLTVIDLRGEIKEQYSLNEIVNEYKGKTYSTNYHDLLDKREKERDSARRSWKTIENIKDLKQGYLSQVIHKISELMVRYNAIVVLEDLNFGFMRGRQKVEKSVYQQFEKMLIDKLNYMVDKKQDPKNVGGLLHAYQLANKFESFQKLGKQSGMLFYIPAWNTSKMDPVTGFVNLFDTHYENVEKSRVFWEKFESIRYNASKKWYEFSFDYNQFTTKAADTQTRWTVCTQGSRIETFRNQDKNSEWDSREINLTEKYTDLFLKYNITIDGDIKRAIVEQTKKEFYEELMHLYKLTLQMRNSKTGTEIDYLVSPVADRNGQFYDSRTCGDTLPKNADANGAYNIARKGLWVVQQIKQFTGTDWKDLKLAISNKEWMQFVQKMS